MTIFWTPSGSLNVAQDPSELPEEANQFDISSGAMVRCKNLRVDQKGIAKTRDGSTLLNETAMDHPVWWVEEQGGTRYSFAGQSIYSDEESIENDLTSAQWSAIKYNAFNDTAQNVFALNGTDRKRIQAGVVYEWGIDAPETAPTLSAGGGAGLTGVYNAKYTYVRKVGEVVVTESDPSPEGTAVYLNGQSLTVSVTQPTDTQVTHIRVYRTTAGGSTYSLAGDIAVNFGYEYGASHQWEIDGAYLSGDGFLFTEAGSTSDSTFAWEQLTYESTATSYVYTQPLDTFDSTEVDADLGDLLETDHDRPPLGSFVFGPAFDGTCFIIKDNLLYYCKPKQPEYWPSTYYVEVSAPQLPGKTGVFHNGQPYYLTATEIYYVQGTGHGTFFPLPMKAKTGAQSINGAVSIAGKGIFHTGPDGIYLFASGSDTKITEETLEPLFRGEDVQGMPGVFEMDSSILFAYGNHLYFAYRSEGYDYPTNLLVMNLDTGRTVYYEYGGIQATAFARDVYNKRLLMGDSDGFVRVIEDKTASQDDIEFAVQSKDFTLQTRAHFPRWNKYDVDASEATECFGELILDNEVFHSHELTENRNVRRRLVGEGNGNRASIRIRGTGAVSIYAVESE